MSITVFSGPGCVKCLVTKKHLRKRGVEFEEIDVQESPEWVDRLKENGFLGLPVVLVNDEDVWEGYSSESIDEWALEVA